MRNSDMVGQTIGGRYQIIKPLGKGGFGTTFLAQDQHHPKKRQVVVKQLTPKTNDLAEIAIIQRLFEREAEILSELNHDQIPELYAYFQENSKFYLVQEFIDGHEITREMSNNLAEIEVIKLLYDILEVLNYLQEKNLIHRDLKPSNIMRRQRDQKIIIIDLGAIKPINPNSNNNSTICIGTEGYMPIEQYRGQPNFTSDLYAIGIIAIQALTGIVPPTFTAEEACQSINNISPQFKNYLNQMVKHDWTKRYSSTQEARNILEQQFFNHKFRSTEKEEEKTEKEKRGLPDPPPKPVISSIILTIMGIITMIGIGITIAYIYNNNILPNQNPNNPVETPEKW